jgi:hypothetical protein
VEQNQTTLDARRYRLLHDYLLANGLVAFQKIEDGDQPFVMDADFYGLTFDQAVDVSGQAKEWSPSRAPARLFALPKAKGQSTT